VSRRDQQRLEDAEVAVQTIRAHLQRGDLHDGLIFDAVRVRLIEIGEAVKGLSADLLASESAIPWTEIARMRDRLAHRYFDLTRHRAGHYRSRPARTGKGHRPTQAANPRHVSRSLDSAALRATSRSGSVRHPCTFA
jgi:uncharacterized protein with HEPN domain